MKLPLICTFALTVFFSGAIRLSAQEKPPIPGSPEFIYSSSGTLLIRWDDNSQDEQSFTLHLRVAGFALDPVLLPSNTNWYVLEDYSGSSFSGYVTAANTGGSSQSQSAGIYDPFEQRLDTYAEWRFRHWGRLDDAGDAASFADPDHDGQPNILEFSLRSNPRNPASLPEMHAGRQPSGALSVSFARNSSEAVALNVEFASSLSGPWRSVPVPAAMEDTLTVADPAPPDGPRTFVRLRVQRLP